MSPEPPLQLTPQEEADLIEAEAEIERGDIATPEEVRAMWAKHGPNGSTCKQDVDGRD